MSQSWFSSLPAWLSSSSAIFGVGRRRIRDLGDTKLFIPKGDAAYDALKRMISSDRLNIKQIRAHWDEILRLATSIKQVTVTASLMLRKLSS